jgi:hypothetical protein
MTAHHLNRQPDEIERMEADPKAEADPRFAAFVAAYVESRSAVTAALAAGYPQWMALARGAEMISMLKVQRAVLLAMPEGADKLEMAKAWHLDPTTADLVGPRTLIEKIAAKRAELAQRALRDMPAQIIITRPPARRPGRTRKVA